MAQNPSNIHANKKGKHLIEDTFLFYYLYSYKKQNP